MGRRALAASRASGPRRSPIAPEALVSAVRRLAGATLSPQGVLRVPVPATASAVGALGSVLRELERVIN